MNYDWSVVWRNADVLWEGTKVTVFLAVTTMAIAIPGGIALALMRLSRIRTLSIASAVFVELFRNLPLILVIYSAYYILPSPPEFGSRRSRRRSWRSALMCPPITARHSEPASPR